MISKFGPIMIISSIAVTMWVNAFSFMAMLISGAILIGGNLAEIIEAIILNTIDNQHTQEETEHDEI